MAQMVASSTLSLRGKLQASHPAENAQLLLCSNMQLLHCLCSSRLCGCNFADSLTVKDGGKKARGAKHGSYQVAQPQNSSLSQSTAGLHVLSLPEHGE